MKQNEKIQQVALEHKSLCFSNINKPSVLSKGDHTIQNIEGNGLEWCVHR